MFISEFHYQFFYIIFPIFISVSDVDLLGYNGRCYGGIVWGERGIPHFHHHCTLVGIHRCLDSDHSEVDSKIEPDPMVFSGKYRVQF